MSPLSAKFDRIILNEYFEPAAGRAARVTIALILPLVWGIWSGHVTDSVWISLGAELLSLVDVRGQYPQRMLVVATGTAAAALCTFLGTLAGPYIFAAAAGMAILSALGGFIRNINDYGPGLALAALILFLFSLEHPAAAEAALHRSLLILKGGMLAFGLILISWPLVPYYPLRRSVALTWKGVADLLKAMEEETRRDPADPQPGRLEEKELALREAINHSMQIISRQQALRHGKQNTLSFQLVELRRLASEAGAALAAVRVSLENEAIQQDIIPASLLHHTLDVFSHAAHRIAVAIVSNREEDRSLAALRVQRVTRSLLLLDKRTGEQTLPYEAKLALQQLSASFAAASRYLEEAIRLLRQNDLSPSVPALSFRSFFNGLSISGMMPAARIEWGSGSFIFRFSMRLAAASAIGILLYKGLHIPRGYWIAMTVLIVLQPEFGATRKKAGQRMLGTITGAIAGSLLMLLPLPLWAITVLAAASCFCLVLFLRRNYAIAVFFVTIMLVMLLEMSYPVTWQLAAFRLGNTIIGSLLAVTAGYALWPIWERHRFPALIAGALLANRDYLQQALKLVGQRSPKEIQDLLRYRRAAEVANSNAFTSLQRMASEPSHKQYRIRQAFSLTGYNVRLTREITALAAGLPQLPEHLPFPEADDFSRTALPALEHLAAAAGGEQLPEGPLPSFTAIIEKIDARLQAKEVTDPHREDLLLIRRQLDKMVYELLGMFFTLNEPDGRLPAEY